MNEGAVFDTNVKEKHNITLTCEASGKYYSCLTHINSLNITEIKLINNSIGNPVPEIKWQKDGQLLVPDIHHQVQSHGRFLYITGAQVADTGRYSCLASNTAGDRSRHFNLNVLGTKTSYIILQGEIIHWALVLCFFFFGSGSYNCSVRSRRLCRGGDSDPEQPDIPGL